MTFWLFLSYFLLLKIVKKKVNIIGWQINIKQLLLLLIEMDRLKAKSSHESSQTKIESDCYIDKPNWRHRIGANRQGRTTKVNRRPWSLGSRT